MAEKTTSAVGVTHCGILPPDEARERSRAYWRSQLAHAQKMLARTDAETPVTYWQGTRRLHPACEERPAESTPVPEHCTPLGEDRGLLLEAAELVINDQYASADWFQRRMRVGFVKACRLMVLLEQRGVIGARVGAGGQEVLVAREDKARKLAAISGEAETADV